MLDSAAECPNDTGELKYTTPSMSSAFFSSGMAS